MICWILPPNRFAWHTRGRFETKRANDRAYNRWTLPVNFQIQVSNQQPIGFLWEWGSCKSLFFILSHKSVYSIPQRAWTTSFPVFSVVINTSSSVTSLFRSDPTFRFLLWILLCGSYFGSYFTWILLSGSYFGSYLARILLFGSYFGSYSCSWYFLGSYFWILLWILLCLDPTLDPTSTILLLQFVSRIQKMLGSYFFHYWEPRLSVHDLLYR